jgi:SAM-dependent methyltransferase
MDRYGKAFYEGRESNKDAAKVVLPIVKTLVDPGSVVDVGCATGIWLSVWQSLGVQHVVGVDGPWVPRDLLEIAEKNFVVADLSAAIPLEGTFDLVVSLEVAEHLPPECASSFVNALCRLGPVVLFSAAIPFQGGVNHLNEQWPDYWAHLFAENGYVPVDCIRQHLWTHDVIVPRSVHLAQNVLIYVDRRRLAEYPLLKEEWQRNKDRPLAVVHPRFFARRADPRRLTLEPQEKDIYESLSLMMVLPMLPYLVKKAVRRRLGRLVGRS